MRIRPLGLAAGLITATMLGACGGGGNAAEVASLGGDGDTPTTEAQGGQSGPDAETRAAFEDALLEFTECMREHGIDMPDPQFEGEGGGGIAIVGGPGGNADFDPESEEFQAANEACEPILEDARQGVEIDPEQQAEMQDRMLEFAECMREHGIDMPDPVFNDEGGVTIGGGPVRGEESDGPLPFDDPGFEEAAEECSDETGIEGPRIVTNGGEDGEE